MQSVALGWLVYDLTRRASLLGTISFCGNVPFIALGLLGGAVADRASRRTIMLGAQVVLASAALALALLTASGRIAVWHVVAIAMVAGTASALYAPVMQAVIPSLVEPADLLNAISLNSVQFNLARVVGPAVAGIVYGAVGPAGCFALNACGFVVLAVALAQIRLPHRPVATRPPMAHARRSRLRAQPSRHLAGARAGGGGQRLRLSLHRAHARARARRARPRRHGPRLPDGGRRRRRRARRARALGLRRPAPQGPRCRGERRRLRRRPRGADRRADGPRRGAPLLRHGRAPGDVRRVAQHGDPDGRRRPHAGPGDEH